MTASEIIKALGGTAEVADALGVSLSVVSNMKLRGVPRSRMLDIHQLAMAKKVAGITPDVIRAAFGRQTAEQSTA